jgi:fatty-acyl-CoA synthase
MGMRGTMMEFPLTLVAVLERAGKFFGKIEIVSREPDRTLHRYSYAEFYRRARALAEALQRAGLERGDRVATLMWNHRVHLEAYFGIPAAGGVLHPLNLRLHPSELAYIANHGGDRFLIVDDVLLSAYEKFNADARFEKVFVVRRCDSAPLGGVATYEDLLATARGDFGYPALDENEGAAMCYTSGTTGKPKGVIYSHRAVVLHSFAEALADGMGICQRDVVMDIPPMFHANGWGLPFTSVMVGAKLVFPGPHNDPESLLDLLAQEQVTMTGAVPTLWIGMCDLLEKHPGRWKLAAGLRGLIAGTAAPESLIRRLDAQGVRLVQLWGMTETTPFATVSHISSLMDRWSDDEKYALRAGQGRPGPGVEIRAVAESGEVPWDGKTMGELHVRGPWVAGSYYNKPEAADRWTSDGWFRTGDVVSIDAHGHIRITDRAKDLIKSGGEWISSVDLENALMGHPAVKEAAVVAVPHPKWDERPLAVIVLREGMQTTPDELRAFLADRFAKWQLPDGFVFTAEIPRTSVGKFLKSKLREQYANWKWES